MIEIRDFSKKYGNRKLFNHFYASFNNNGLYAILGKSGCGKSQEQFRCGIRNRMLSDDNRQASSTQA